MRLRYVAPAGAPVPFSALAASVAASIGRHDPGRSFERDLRALLGIHSCHVVSTGRAGLTLLLRTLRRLTDPERDEVLIPSYTCYSVAGSVVKAGLNVRLADVDPATLDFDYDRLRRADLRRVVAIVATNLYGLPNDMPRLLELARERGCLVVDDAAQAFGARVAGRWCGTAGDGGILSLDKGKNLSAIDGGVVLTNVPQVADALAAEVDRLPRPSASDVVRAAVKTAAYATLLRPRLYWLPNSIPALGLGQTVYTTDYPIARHPAFLSALALTMVPSLDAYTAQRRLNAQRMLASLHGLNHLRPITPVPSAEPVYLRLPALLRHRELRDMVLAELNRAGIGASGSYPASIADIPALAGKVRGDERDALGGRDVASRILTLPTHPYVTEPDCRLVTGVLRRAVGATDDARDDADMSAAAAIR